MNVTLAENLGMFFGGEYLYGKVKKISGEGYWKRSYTDSFGLSSSNSGSWEGDWYVMEISATGLSWGDYETELPESDPQFLDSKVRDFVLDLSGFRVIFGFFFRF